MAERRRGLGRGLGALIPPTPAGAARPIDLFFADAPGAGAGAGSAPAEHDEAGAHLPRPSAATRSAQPSDAAAAVGSEGGPAAAGDAGLVQVPGARFSELPLGQVVPNPRQPRQHFDEEAMAELVHSVREIGVLQPVVVRQVAIGPSPVYELVMGERRWRASQLAGVETVPAIIRDTADDDLLRDALLENLHRSELNPLEEAAAYQQLLDDFGCTHDQLAQRIGRSRPQISNTIRLLRLPPPIQRRVAAAALSAGHARALLGLTDGAGMEQLAQRIVAEGLSVRATEEAVALGGRGDPRQGRQRREAGQEPSGFDDLAARLSDRLEARVGLAMGQRKGKLTVEFTGVDHLNRILATLAPGDPGVAQD